MKFSYSWLKDLVDIKLPPVQLAEELSLRAFETELAEKQPEFSGIIVAKVTKIEKHPNADRLRLIELTDGKQKYWPVVCGAWNFDINAIVPLALPGAMIPQTQTILSEAIIRGVTSQGMICSAKELGLSDETEGIMVLDSSYELGLPFTASNRHLSAILDISVPANRPDLLSYRGVAWEIAALTGAKFNAKNYKLQTTNYKPKLLKIRISEPALCKKYIGVRLSNIQVRPSPKFIQERLKFSGIRPINNVVDISNYAMLEIGQPLHAFDAGKVIGPINVRTAYVNESIKTLDGQVRRLTTDMLVVSDSKKALAVAGVMGGADSAVTQNTNEIILEAANFNAVSVRRTTRNLGLRTDSSSRFEKSLPLAFAQLGAFFAIELLVKYAKAKPLEYVTAGVKPENPAAVVLDPNKVNLLLGTEISASRQRKILHRFGFTLQASRSTLRVSVPFWRIDARIWQDLAEEIARFEGLDKIPSKLISLPNSSLLTDPLVKAREKTSEFLVNMGFSEIYTYSFISELDLKKWGIDKASAVEIENPISSDQQFLRPNLAVNALKVAERNSVLDENSLAFGKYFEIGNVYWKNQGEVFEKTHLFMLSFPRTKKSLEELIGDFHALSSGLGIKFEIKQEQEQFAQILIAGKNAGSIGTFSASKLDWVGASLDFEEFSKNIKLVQFKPIGRFPSITLDASILIRENIPWQEIKKTILSVNSNLISEIKLLEGFYQGKEISPEKKGVTFRIVYQAKDRTLTKDEALKVHEQILSVIKAKFSAQIRD